MKASDCAHIAPALRIKRHPERGAYDAETIYSVVDEAWICHVAWTDSRGTPWVIPTAHWRVGPWLYIHGSSKSRVVLAAQGSPPKASISIALVDGLVLARSAFNHSMNYRSVIVHGTLYTVTDPQELEDSAAAFIDKIQDGRSAQVRAPDAKEWRATGFLKMNLRDASAKIRTGPPKDQDRDLGISVDVGVCPVERRLLPLDTFVS